jgi:hypothetical protein
VSTRYSDPDYRLAWPRSLFLDEAAKLLSRALNQRDQRDWNDRCELLLEQAFVSGYEGGPLAEFRAIPDIDDPWGTPKWGTPKPATPKQNFLHDFLRKADQLSDDSSRRRPYWRERKAGPRASVVLDTATVVIHRSSR